MGLVLLPAIDVAHGQVQRGDLTHDPHSVDPFVSALAWQADGAEWIHLVDLDAAFERGTNDDLLASIVGRLDIPVELSGGISEDVGLDRALRSGAARAVLSTDALTDLDWCVRAISEHGDRIAIALDVSVVASTDGTIQHTLTARGSTNDQGDLVATLQSLDQAGCARYIVTDVSADGMLTGPNLELYRLVLEATPARVIASGGVSGLSDLVALAELADECRSLEGAIVGRALHTGRFTLTEALTAASRARS